MADLTQSTPDLAGACVGVTGATGFVGRHIARGLVAAGARVVGIVRRPERGADLARAGVELRRADLLDPVALAEAMGGLDALVSNASIAVARDPDGRVREHAQLETSAVLGAVRVARDRGVDRIVHISSVAVYRRVPVGRPGLESDPRRGMRRNLASWFFRRGYGEAKAQVEDALWAEPGLRLTVLRPGPVYGSGDVKVLEQWGRWLRGPFAVVPDVAVPFVHAGDVADAVTRALACVDCIGLAYNVTGQAQSIASITRVFRRLIGAGGPTIAIPLPITVEWSNDAIRRDLGLVFRSIESGIAESLGTQPIGAADDLDPNGAILGRSADSPDSDVGDSHRESDS